MSEPRRVADAMREPVVLVQPSTTILETSARLLDAGFHTAVVLDGGVVCGRANAVTGMG